MSGSVNSPDGAPLASLVSNTGTLQADGGMVTLHAKAAAGLVRSVVNQEGVVRATSLVNHGGVIKLIADGEDATAWNKGVLDISAGEPGAAAGSVTISAPYAGQSGMILAAGGDGSVGGRVEITSTKESGLFANSLIDVSGLGNADAGSVRVWSDNYTVFSANAVIVARGGELGGNGGFVEVSGLQALNVAGFVDARAPYGATGTLLLDPHNITVATGGVGLLTDVDQFTDTPLTDITIAPATINAAGANVVLQANNDITFTDAVSIAGAGIGLTAQAGRSILISAGITTNNAPISLTANETTANGVVDANRDAGTAIITMAAGTSLTSGGSDITIMINTGAGLTNSTSGSITIEGVNAGVGNVLVVNNGPTAASSIVRASANELITAASVALDVNGAGGGGGIGTSGSPIRVSVTNLEARAQSLGTYITTPTLAVNIGGSTLGGLTGISTSSNGAISVTTTATSITTGEAISATGSGTVTLTAVGAASSIITNDALTSGSGAVTLTARNGVTLSGAAADVTTTGAYTVNADSDSNGTGTYTQNNAGSAVSSGAVTITAQDIDLVGTINAGSGAVTLKPAAAATTIGVEDASKTFKLTDTELDNITTTFMTIGSSASAGGITIGTDGPISQTKSLNFLSNGGIQVNGAISTGNGTYFWIVINGSHWRVQRASLRQVEYYAFTDTGGTGNLALLYTQQAGASVTSSYIWVRAADIDLQGTMDAGSGPVYFLPFRFNQTVGVEDASKSFKLSNAELSRVTTSGTLQIGYFFSTGGITIGTDAPIIQNKNLKFEMGSPIQVNGAISTGSSSLTLNSYNGVTLASTASVTTTSTYTANADFDANGTGVYTQQVGSMVSSGAPTITAQNITLLGTIDAGSAAIILKPSLTNATIGVEDASKSFNVTNAQLTNITTSGTVTIGAGTNTGGITLGTDAAINAANKNVELSTAGAIASSGGAISAGDLTLNGSSVGSASMPVILGTIAGELSGTLSGAALTDVFNVKSATSSTINLGVVTATSGGIGHPVTLDSTGGSILHVHPGTDITGGRVNFWGTSIGALNFDLQVITDNPPVMCNGVPCGLPFFVNTGTATYDLLFGLSLSGYYLLGATPEEGKLLTAGVLPDQIYSCLNQNKETVTCTADAIWGEDEGAKGVMLAEAAPHSNPRIMRLQAQRTSALATQSNVLSG